MDDIATPIQGSTNQKQEKPKWIVNLESNIERIKAEISHVQVIVQVIINCKNRRKFTKHQNTILNRLTNKSGKYQKKNLKNQTSITKTRPEK